MGCTRYNVAPSPCTHLRCRLLAATRHDILINLIECVCVCLNTAKMNQVQENNFVNTLLTDARVNHTVGKHNRCIHEYIRRRKNQYYVNLFASTSQRRRRDRSAPMFRTMFGLSGTIIPGTRHSLAVELLKCIRPGKPATTVASYKLSSCRESTERERHESYDCDTE